MLSRMSCLGYEAETRLICITADLDVSVVDTSLDRARASGLVECPRPGLWRFTHDQVQQGAYALISDNEREELHLWIGRKLWASYNNDEDSVGLHVVLAQLRKGARLIEDEDERYRGAELMLHAGERASVTSSFALAASYLQMGIDLLGKRHWRDEYVLSLNLYNAAAEVAYCLGNFSESRFLIDEVLCNSRCKEDEVRTLSLAMCLRASSNELREAIDMAVRLLGNLGISLPVNYLLLRLIASYKKLRRRLISVTDDEILALPHLSDPAKLSAMGVLPILFSTSFMGRPLLSLVISVRIIDMTLDHGLCSSSAWGFAAIGLTMCSVFKDVDLGTRFARLGLRLLDHLDAREW